MKMEIVLPDDLVEETIETIMETARTGEIGDGRVFVLPVECQYNIRTGEND
jgi:nitrogen regulatory protein P-II 1